MSTNATSSDNSTPETASSPAADSSSATTPSSTTAGLSTSTPDPTSTSTTEATTPSSTSTSETPTSTSTTPTTSDTPTSTSTPSSTTTTSTPSSTSTSLPSSTTTTTPTSVTPSVTAITTQQSTDGNGSTAFITVTSTQLNTNTAQSTTGATSTDASGSVITSNAAQSGAIAEPAKIAVAVVVPIAAVALLVIGGIFFWRKRKQRRDAAEERRKEVEDYSYNPNNDPTLPDMGAGGAGAYEMKEDGGSSGYRGWGSTTLAGSTGRKASTTMSGGAAGVAYSDATSPTRGNFSDTRSGDGLMGEGSQSPQEGEILGAMGPGATDNRGNGEGNVHRGPSNASSSYSAAGRSDGSGENAGSYSGPAYLDQYGGNNPYADGAYGQQQLGGQPVIRDNPARRNTRIENPSHYPQQSAGISQNF
ncbi:hypothetical protein F5B19DRAFT_491533 [Rostrohypoxylon terebratum]|nr:hypothetical protein F5B19DRAFT_491533 [Rostrohypoxylon terebratum]